MSDDFDPLGESDSSPAIGFKDEPIGTVKTIDVEDACKLVQQRDYDTSLPAYWHPTQKGKRTTDPNDKPCMAVVFNGVNADGEPVSLWAPKPSDLFAKIKAAQEQLGRRIGVGHRDRIHVKLTGRVPAQNPKFNKNEYAVKIETLGAAAPAATDDPFGEPPF